MQAECSANSSQGKGNQPHDRRGPIHGLVEPLTHNLYTKSTDQTRVIIYTPLRFDWIPVLHGVKPESWQYRNRINDIKDAVQRALGTGVSIEVNPYWQLNYMVLTSLDGSGIPVNYYDGTVHTWSAAMLGALPGSSTAFFTSWEAKRTQLTIILNTGTTEHTRESTGGSFSSISSTEEATSGC